LVNDTIPANFLILVRDRGDYLGSQHGCDFLSRWIEVSDEDFRATESGPEDLEAHQADAARAYDQDR
jgi:hypothetical protein